jgi:predicted SprT family Zn-dependent metalloprotease
MTTKAEKKQKKEDYHIACQGCATTVKPLQMIPLRNNKNVVGFIFACDECTTELMGQKFDIEAKFK